MSQDSKSANSTPLAALDRRTLLKGAGALLGASALPLKSLGQSPSASTSEDPSFPFRKGYVGFTLAHEQFNVTELVRLGILAEQAGFAYLATSDHLQPWQTNQGHSGQAWTTLGALSYATSKIWMGTGVTCPTIRYNPAVVAEAFASLSFLTNHRIFLGIGSGEALNEKAATGYWPSWTERSHRLVEASKIIRMLWTGQEVDFDGQFYHVHAKLYDVPQQAPPLLMAGNGPKALYRAGRWGDGLITDPKTWKTYKSQFYRGAQDAGKDPNQMPVLVELFVVVGGEDQARIAAELWRFLPKAWHPYYNIEDPRLIEHLANQQVPLSEVIAQFVVSADPSVHAQAILEQFAGGVTEVHVHSGQWDQRRVIEFYGNEVLPRLPHP
jgi:TAT-translocated FGD2 family F420-dependent dehydrogenase